MSSRAVPDVSVVIPSRGTSGTLRLTLACLAGQAEVIDPEIIVVDDGTGTPVADTAAEASAHMKLTVVAGPHRGRAAARNAGAAQATAGRLIFLDDDILVTRGFLSAHLAAPGDAFSHGTLRELPAAARLRRELDGASWEEIRDATDRVWSGSAGPPFRLVANSLERAIEAMADGTMEDVAPWLGCVGANTSMPRPAWRRAGGFDEDFGTAWGCEDLELGYRLHELGLRRQVLAQAAGIHLSHARPGRWDEHACNMSLFASKHPVPSVRSLPALLSADGSPRSYSEAVRSVGSATGSRLAMGGKPCPR